MIDFWADGQIWRPYVGLIIMTFPKSIPVSWHCMDFMCVAVKSLNSFILSTWTHWIISIYDLHVFFMVQLTCSVELRWLQSKRLNGPDPALLRLCWFGGMARFGPVTPAPRSHGTALHAPPGPLEARAVRGRSTHGVPGPLLRPAPALQGGRPVRLGVGHVARPQRTDLVLNPCPDAACGQRGGFLVLLWCLLRVDSSLGSEMGAVLRVEHGVPQPRDEPLKGEAAMRWCDPPEAAQHPTGQFPGVCALPAALDLRDVDITPSPVVQNVKQGPQAVQEGFGQAICWILRLFRLHFGSFKVPCHALKHVFSRPNSAVNRRGSVQLAALVSRYQSHEGPANLSWLINQKHAKTSWQTLCKHTTEQTEDYKKQYPLTKQRDTYP